MILQKNVKKKHYKIVSRWLNLTSSYSTQTNSQKKKEEMSNAITKKDNDEWACYINGTIYIQIKKVAMRSPLAFVLADFFITELE